MLLASKVTHVFVDNVNSDVANLISGKMFGYGKLGLIYYPGCP